MIEVTLNECMGDDLTVANAARVSFRKKSSYMPRVHAGEPKVLRHEDRKLIVFLAKEKHISCRIHKKDQYLESVLRVAYPE